MFLLLNQGILLFFFVVAEALLGPLLRKATTPLGRRRSWQQDPGPPFLLAPFFFLFFSFLVRVAWFVFVFVCFFFALEPGRNERESAREVRSSSSVWIWCISPEKKKFFLVWKSILWRFFFKWMNEWQRTMSNLFLSIRSHQSIHFNYFFNVSLPIWIH